MTRRWIALAAAGIAAATSLGLTSISGYKTFTAEVLTVADLNSSFSRLLDSGVNPLIALHPGDSTQTINGVFDSLDAMTDAYNIGVKKSLVFRDQNDSLIVGGRGRIDSVYADTIRTARLHADTVEVDSIFATEARINSLLIGTSAPMVGTAFSVYATAGQRGWFASVVQADTIRSDSISVTGDVSINDDLLLTSTGAILAIGPSSDVTLTQSSNVLTLAGGDLLFQDAVALALGTGSDSELEYNGTNTIWNLRAVGTGNLLLNNGIVIIGDGTTTSNANMTLGLTIDQRANDNNALELLSSDVAHGLTSAGINQLTSTYWAVLKSNATVGGAILSATAENAAITAVASFYSFGGQASATQSTASVGLVDFFASQHDGANALAAATNSGVMYSFRGRNAAPANVCLFLIDEDGDILYDGADGGAYAREDDPGILYALENETARPGEAVLREGSRWMRHNRASLMEIGVLSKITPEEASQGHRPMVNGSILDRLHTGGIVQNAAKIDFLGERAWMIDEVLDSLRTENRTLHQRVAVLEWQGHQGPMIFERSY